MKHSINMFIQGSPNHTGEPNWMLYPFDMTDNGYISAGTTTVEFEVPENFNVNQAEIDMLTAAKAKIEKDASARTFVIDERIRNLQCLEYRP